MKKTALSIFAIAGIVTLSSCASIGGENKMTVDDIEIDTKGEGQKSQMVQTIGGKQVSNTNGIPIGQTMQDATGTYQSQPGPYAVTTLNRDGTIFNTSPGDAQFTATGFNMTVQEGDETTSPPKPTIIITANTISFGYNLTPVLEVQAMGYEDAKEALLGLSEDQKQAKIEQWKVSGEVTQNALVRLIAELAAGGV